MSGISFFIIATLCAAIIGCSKPSQIDSKMNQEQVTGISLVAIKNYKISSSTQLGLLKNGSNAKINEKTVFEAASLGKPVFAYGVLKLFEENNLDLDKPLYHYFKYKELPKEQQNQITARMILSHSSGLPSWHQDNTALNVKFKPGSKFNYSGEGYLYLQKVIEKLSGKTLEKY